MKINDCPFCGSENVGTYGTLNEDTGVEGPGFVKCDNCNAKGPPADGHDSYYESIRAWNRAADAVVANTPAE